ncbi:hypothetical protein PSPO01_02894 [Paraphaeosphaeria sporulosa]
MVVTMSRVHRRAVEAARFRGSAREEGAGRLTYFAVTGGLKDAWCIVGADRGVGDVHSRQRVEGGGELGVEGQAQTQGTARNESQRRRRTSPAAGHDVTAPGHWPATRRCLSVAEPHQSTLLSALRPARFAACGAVSARPRTPPSVARDRCVLIAPPTTTRFGFYRRRPRRVRWYGLTSQPVPPCQSRQSHPSRPLTSSLAPSLSAVSADARSEDARPACWC